MRTASVNLSPFVRRNLDLLFVGLNPPQQSNANGHYFSGQQSRFFDLIHRGGLITAPVRKENADDIVFGGTSVNFKQKAFGVVDLIADVVMTDSGKVRAQRHHVETLLGIIRSQQPRVVCIIHGKVAAALSRHGALSGPLVYGICGAVIPGSDSIVALNYFPNGNPIPDSEKLAIFGKIKNLL